MIKLLRNSILLGIFASFIFFFLPINPAHAYSNSNCDNQCGPNERCVSLPSGNGYECVSKPQQAQNPFGQISAPFGVKGLQEGGLSTFLTAIFSLLIVASGIYAVFNVIIAGYQFMNAGGSSENIEKAWGRLWQTLVGLLLIAGSFLIAAIISQILFGKADRILSPSIFTPQQ